jgi:transcriptional regulator with XRE-family HTH domain
MNSPAARLKFARIRTGLYPHATDAARKLRIHPTTYENYENGDRGFANHAPRLARFYKVNLPWLMDGVGPVAPGEVERLFSDLPPEGQGKAMEYLEMLHEKYAKRA